MALSYLFDPTIQISDLSGALNVDGFLRVYLSDTDDRAVTYSDFNGTPNQPDIALDANGRAVVIVDSTKVYRLEVYDRSGNLRWTQYPMWATGSAGGSGGNATNVTSTDGSVEVTRTTSAGVTTFDLSVDSVDSVESLGWIRCDGSRLVDGYYRPLYTDGTMSVGPRGIILDPDRYYHVTGHVTCTAPQGVAEGTRIAMNLAGRDRNYGDMYPFQQIDWTVDRAGAVMHEFSTDIKPTRDVELMISFTGPDGISCVVDDVEVHRIYAGVPQMPPNLQERLVPGANIIIEGDVISATAEPQRQADWNETDTESVQYIQNKPENLVQDADYHHTDNNFTDTEKNKLAGIEAGAEVNVQSDWAQTNSSADDFIKNKPANLVQDANYVHTDNNYTTAEKDKLASIASGAQVNVIETVKRNGVALPVSDKAVDVSVPVPADAAPSMDGVAAAGSASSYSRQDHVHPTDTTRQAVANMDSSIPSVAVSGHYPSTDAVKSFVNSSVATATADFLGHFSLADLGLTYPATDVQIASALNSHTWPAGVTPTNNDYVYVEIANPSTPAVDDKVERFKYSDASASWGYEYTLNNSSFTAAEIAAIDSGITATDKGNYDAHLANTNNPHHVTKDQVGLGNVTDGAQVADVNWDSTNGKITKTIGSSTTDVVSASTLKTAMSLGNVDNTSDATKKTNFTGSIASGNTGFVTGGDAYTALNRKADKVASATSGNFAGLDANGNLTDSGSKASDFIQKSSTTGLVRNDGSIDTNSYLTTTGAGQNVTSTFTKNAGDNSGMASGGKLSTLFTAISDLFASLKALAFKATVGTGDIDNDAITAAKVKDNETLPVNVSGNAATATNLAPGGTSGQYLRSNGSGAPTWEDLPPSSISTDMDSSAFDGNTTIATGFSNNKIHLNTASRLWTYIQDRISSVLGLTINNYGGKAAAASVADLANRANDANSADSVDWANVTNKPATTFIGDYGSTPYNKWFTEYAAGKQLVCRVGPVLNGYTYYYLDMLGRQGTDPITFSRLVSTANATNATQHISTVVCNPDNSYAIIGNDVSGTTGTYLNLTVGMAKSVGNQSGSDAVALTTAGLGITNGTKSVSAGNGVVSASDGFVGDLTGNAATATKADVLQDNTISNKVVGATTNAQASASDYIAMWVENTIVKVHTNKFTAYAAHRDASGNGIVATYQRKDAIGVGNTTWTRSAYLTPSSGTVPTSIPVSLVSSGTIAIENLIINTTESGTVSGGTNTPGPVILTIMLCDASNLSTIYEQQVVYTAQAQTLSIPLVVYYSGSSDDYAIVCVKMETASGYWKGGITGKLLYINR